MPKETSPGKPTTRRYTDAEKADAVRLVRQLREELGTDHGTVQRIARQLGYGVESVRTWVTGTMVPIETMDAVMFMVSAEIRSNRRPSSANRSCTQETPVPSMMNSAPPPEPVPEMV